MNRRGFLAGAVAAALAPSLPPLPAPEAVLPIYGTSPAMDVMEDIKALHEAWKEAMVYGRGAVVQTADGRVWRAELFRTGQGPTQVSA